MKMRMIQCGRQTVRVIQPDGQVRQLSLPVSVGDLVGLHPHHYVCHATNRRGSILPLDAQLDSGGIYLLLPLPRLFPTSSASSPSPHQCSCLLQAKPSRGEEAAVKCGPSIWMSRRPWGLNSKISPEGSIRDGHAGGKCASSAVKRSRLWEPSLEIILENDLLLLTKDERESVKKKLAGGGGGGGGEAARTARAAAKLGKSPW